MILKKNEDKQLRLEKRWVLGSIFCGSDRGLLGPSHSLLLHSLRLKEHDPKEIISTLKMDEYRRALWEANDLRALNVVENKIRLDPQLVQIGRIQLQGDFDLASSLVKWCSQYGPVSSGKTLARWK